MPDHKSVRLPLDLVAKIDAARGDVPRERWVRRALEAALGVPPERPASPRTSVDLEDVLEALRCEAYRHRQETGVKMDTVVDAPGFLEREYQAGRL